MSGELLPEEILSQILRYAIVPDPDTFLDPAHDRAYFHTPQSPASSEAVKPSSPLGGVHLLLVSKRWLRIGTPLLFVSLWLSTSAHTTSVAHMLAVNPTLGASVRDLRLEGGFGEGLDMIVHHAPNLKHVHLGYMLQAWDPIEGLLAVLPKINVRRFYVGHMNYNGSGGPRAGKKHLSVSKLLDTAIAKTWTQLVYLSLSSSYSPRSSNIFDVAELCPPPLLVHHYSSHGTGTPTRSFS